MASRAKDYDEPGPDEGPKPICRWGLVFDGASNAYGHGIAAIIITHRGSHILFTARICFDYTNNMASKKILILGLRSSMSLGIQH